MSWLFNTQIVYVTEDNKSSNSVEENLHEDVDNGEGDTVGVDISFQQRQEEAQTRRRRKKKTNSSVVATTFEELYTLTGK